MAAGSRQEGLRTTSLLEVLRPAVPEMAHEVAVDVPEARPATELAAMLERLIDVLDGSRLAGSELAALRAEGAAAARAGRPLQVPIDEYLTSAWVLWSHARASTSPEHLAEIAGALLRAGDDIAAALSDGYTEAERVLAARAGAVRRAVLEELVTPAPDEAGRRRVARRAELVGLDPSLAYGVTVVRAVAELEDEGALSQAVARRLARGRPAPATLVAVRGGELVVLAPERGGAPAAIRDAILEPADEPRWAGAAGPVPLAEMPVAFLAARDAVRVARALDVRDRIVRAADVALERALLADPALLGEGVAAVLGPLGARRRGALVETLEAWFAEGEAVVATARRLGIAPRTVSYRLERIAELLGVDRLTPDLRLRLATALLARRLLAGLDGRP